MKALPSGMGGKGFRKGPMLAVELGPKAFVIAAKMAEEDWSLALPVLPTLPAHCELEPAR